MKLTLFLILSCALACNVVLYGQAKQTIAQQQAQIAKLKRSKDKLYRACTDSVYADQRRRMREWELKHGYR